MDTQKGIICRLCLKIQNDPDYFRAIKEEMKDALDKVLQKMDFAAFQNPVICTICADSLMKCFDFKAKCMNTHDYIASFINKDTVKLDLVDVYMSKNGSDTGVLAVEAKVQDVCGLCMSPLKNCSVLSFDIEGDLPLKRMFERCFPELDMNIIKKPVICLPCNGSLENSYRFLTNCSIVEEKIKNYFESQNIDSDAGADLSSLLQFVKTEVTGNLGGISTDLIKVEGQFCEKIENADEAGIHNGGDIFKFEEMSGNDSEHFEKFEFKSECFMDINELKFTNEEHFTPQNMLAGKDVIKMEEPFCKETRLKEENVEMEDHKLLLNGEAEIKGDESDFNRFEEPKVSKGDLKIHLLTHKNPSEVTMHKCDSCSYQTKYKSDLKEHFLKHKDPSEVTMYKCDSCSFQTKYKKYLNIHFLNHKDLSELSMYKCDLCSYETKSKSNLQRHSWKHKDSSEIIMYKCDSCSYQTKSKRNFRVHSLKHRDPSEVTMYKCDSCSFDTKHKGNLNRHFLLKHKNPPEVTMHKCDSCSYQTNNKRNLQLHSLTHKDPSQVTMYKCDSCSFDTKHKIYLNRHFLLKHKNPSEVTMHKCYLCSYQTKCKIYLQGHLLKHKDPTEVTMYKCDSCSFQTKYKKNLTTHLLKHMDPSEVAMYKCEFCSFHTKRKESIEIHLLNHMDPSEVTMYKCDSCSFETKHKTNLNKHLLKHKNPLEVTMHKCDSCSFETKHKRSLNRHLLKHKKTAEVNVQM